MAVSHTHRRPLDGTTVRAADTVVYLPDHLQRRQKRRRAPGAGPGRLAHWRGPYGPDGAHYDALIRQVWGLRSGDVIDDAEAGRRDVALRQLRYALGEGREAWV